VYARALLPPKLLLAVFAGPEARIDIKAKTQMKALIKGRMERALRHSGVLAAVGAAVCGLWLSSGYAKELVPFKETAQATVTGQSGATEVIDGTGNATYMGSVSVHAVIDQEEIGLDVHPEYGEVFLVHIVGTLDTTAADGSILFSNIDALYIIPLLGPGHFLAYIEGSLEVTGGTKRFKNATGSMSIEGTDEAVEGMTQSLISLETEGLLSSVGTKMQ
jgi:hypothetical protein